MKKNVVMFRKVFSLFLSVAMVMALVSCGKSQENTNSSSTNTPAPIQQDNSDKTDLVIVTSTDMESFDPTYSSNISNLNVLNMVYNRLYELDENLGGVPVLAEKTEYLSDTELMIKIYEGITFHDGTEMTSEDVQYSLLRAKEAASAKALMEPIKDVEIVDKYTVKITTDSIYPAITTAFTHVACSILPKAYVEQALADNDWSHPIGSGRYVFTSRSIGENVVLTKYDNYWNPDDGAQNTSLTFKVIPEGASRTIMVETGEADLNINFQTSDYERASTSETLALHSYPSATLHFVSMDNNHEWFSKPEVRQAVNFAIDKEAVLLAGYDGLGTVLDTYVAPGCLGYKDESGAYTYDLEKAKALMEEAGCPGFTVDLVVWSDTLERIAVVVQGYLSQIGITANITRVESGMRSQLDAAGQMPMYVGTWGCYQDPDLFLARLFGESGLGANNWSHYTSDEFEELYALARSTVDETVRSDYYGQIQDLLVESAPWCPLFVSTMFALSTKDLQGVELNVEAPFNFYKLHY